MKIEKQVETFVDVEVEVTLEDIVCAISESTESLSLCLRGISNCHRFLQAIPDEIVAQMNANQHQIIGAFLKLQALRFNKQPPVTENDEPRTT